MRGDEPGLIGDGETDHHHRPRAGDDRPREARPGPDALAPTEEATADGSWEPRPGMELFGRFEVIRKLGQGGMGSVWLVRRTDLDCLRALKLIAADAADDDASRSRFRSEALLMARLSHAHAVTLHDARLGDGGMPAYLEMEYIRGRSLDRVLVPGHAAAADWLARLLGQLCDVIDALHAMGAVHRDIKPSNLMLVDGRPPGRELLKVLDYGIAKSRRAEDLTNGGLIGSLPYVAPEQIRGAAEPRSDLYSIGVLLFEALTGVRPFRGTAAELIHAHLSSPPPRFAEVAPRLDSPPGLEDLVLRCLAKDPADRPPSAGALARAFASAASASATVAADPTCGWWPPEAVDLAVLPADTTPSHQAGDEPAAPPLPRWRRPAMAAALLVSTATVSFWWARPGGGDRPSYPGPIAGLPASPRPPIDRPGDDEAIPAPPPPGPSAARDSEVIPSSLPGPVDPAPAADLAPPDTRPVSAGTGPAAAPVLPTVEPMPGDVAAEGPEMQPAPTPEPEPVPTEGPAPAVPIADGAATDHRDRGEPVSQTPPMVVPGEGPPEGVEPIGGELLADLGRVRLPESPSRLPTPTTTSPPIAVEIDGTTPTVPAPGPIPPPVVAVARVEAIDLTLLRVPGGRVFLGEHPDDPFRDPTAPIGRHATVPSAFYLGATEVTIGQYEAVIGDKGRSVKRGSSRYPITSVTWVDAARFCNALGRRGGLPPYYAIDEGPDGDRDEAVSVLGGLGFRLPTEPEWEASCRALGDEAAPWSFGRDPAAIARFAWTRGDSGVGPEGVRRYHDVRRLEATSIGFFDLHGNAWEWCGPSAPGPVGPMQAIRGGSYDRPAAECRTASREVVPIHRYAMEVGFRVARDAE